MILTFFDNSYLDRTDNIDTIFNDMKYENDVINDKNRLTTYLGYGSIYKTKNKYELFFSGWDDLALYQHCASKYYATSNDGINFAINKDNVFSDALLSTHSCIFFDSNDNNYKLIGGVYVYAAKKFKRMCTRGQGAHNLKCYKHTKIENINNYPIISDKIYNPCKINGLYILKSDNLQNWKYIQKTPLQFNIKFCKNDFKYQFDMYDSHVSCFYDDKKNKYVLYTRKNIGRGIRNVQISESSDFINWSNWKILNFDPVFNNSYDNYYIFKVVPYLDTKYYIGFSNYSNKKSNVNGIFFMISVDGIKWKRCQMLLNLNNNFEHPSLFALQGNPILSLDEKLLYIYINNNFKAISRYSIRVDGFVHITNKDKNKKSTVITKLLNINKNIFINYQTFNDGFIKIGLMNKNKTFYNKYSLDNNNVLKSDNTKELISWKDTDEIDIKQAHIYIELKNANIYSIYF